MGYDRTVLQLCTPVFAIMFSAWATNAHASCFVAGTQQPSMQTLAADRLLDGPSRALAKALFDGRLDRAEKLLLANPGLAQRRVRPVHDMLSVAIATCRPQALALLVRHGAPLDGVEGEGLPLRLALRAKDPSLARLLLKAGARPTPPARPTGPLRTAITLNGLGQVRMLLDFGADPNAMEATGNRPLHIALDMEHFAIAELLLDRGADPWAIDSGGANLASSATLAIVTASPAEASAQRRLVERVRKLGWPDPAPSPAQIRALALRGAWPPARAQAAGAAAVPAAVLAIISANAR